MRGRGVGVGVAVSLLAACAGGGPSAAAPEPAVGPSAASVWDGVYTADQAERGRAAYARACSSCHAADLRGSSNAPGLVGVGFLFLWEGRSVGDLYEEIRTRMPTNAPNSLPAATYVEIVTHVLEANGFPSGAGELTPDPAVLGRISIAAR